MMADGQAPIEERRFWRTAVVIGTAIFVTGLGWPGLIGRLPFGLLLKNRLHMSPEKVAAFWAVGTLAWYFKPLFGLICDARPLFGTRRRGYLLLGTMVATAGWLAFAVLPLGYGVLMADMTVLNLGLVVVSVAAGGMQVEEGGAAVTDDLRPRSGRRGGRCASGGRNSSR